MTLARTAEERLILARAALIKAEESRARKAKLKAERKARGTVDRNRERDNGFLAYLRRQPCEAASLGGCGGKMDPAHIRYNDGPHRLNPGGGRKNHDHHCNPLCRVHHDEQHKAERYFWERLGKDPYETAARHFAAYQGVTDETDGDAGYAGPLRAGVNQK